jgi:hypothetical protein
MSITPPIRAVVTTEFDAVSLTNAVLDALEALEPVIEQESAFLSEGETAKAIALHSEKTEKAQDYLKAIETLKANVVAVQRLRPDALDLIRDRHDAFSVILAYNMQVLTTARSVSESIIREVATEVARAQDPAGYGPNAKSRSASRPRSAPLAVSKQA